MLCVSIMLYNILLNAQSLVSISGKVTDKQNKAIENVSVVVSTTNGSNTDAKGIYKIDGLKKGTYILRFSCIGYETHIDTLLLTNSLVWNVRLSDTIINLNEIVIKNDYIEAYKKENTLPVKSLDEMYIKQNLGSNLMKSLEQLPGISTIDIGSGQSKPVIRGLGFNRIVVIDKNIKHEGQQWGSDHGLEIDQYDVENISVVKGPASLRYGSDAIGGVIQINANAIPDSNTFSGSVDISGKTNNDFIGTSVALQGRKKSVFAGFRYTLLDYGDYKVPTDSIDIYSYRAALSHHRMRNTAGNEQDIHFMLGFIGNSFQSTIYVSDYYSKNGMFANAHGLEPRQVDENLHDASARDILYPYQTVNHLKIIHNTHWETGLFDFAFDGGFQRNFRQELNNYVGHGYMPANFPDSLPFASDLEREFDKYIYSAAFHSVYHCSKKTDFSSGINFDFQNNRIDGREFIIPAFQQINSGIFLIAHHRFTKHHRIEAGIRYDYGYLHTETYHDWYQTPVVSGNDTTFSYLSRSVALKRNFSNLSASFGYVFSLNHWLLKINIGRSFRMPTAKELAANGINYSHFSYEIGNASLQPEIAYQWDAGIEFDNRTLNFSIEPFVNYFTNYIFLNPTSEYNRLYGSGNQIYEYTQCQVFRCGGEASVSYTIVRWLELALNGEYVFARQMSGEKKGYALPFSPPLTATGTISYRPTLHKIVYEPYLSFEVKGVAPQTDIVPPEEPTDGYFDLSLKAGGNLLFKNQKLLISMQLQNLLNSNYYNHTGYYRLINVPEPGRNFILSLTLPFTGHLIKKIKNNT